MAEVNNEAYEYADEEGLKEFSDDILTLTEYMLDSYISPRLDENSTVFEMPSAAITNQTINVLSTLLEELIEIDQDYKSHELYELQQLADTSKGELLPIPTDIIVIGTGNIEDVVAQDIATNHPIRDEREGIRYRYYVVRETESDPYALYIYELGEWRVVGYTKKTLTGYWNKITEKEEIVDRILNGTADMPSEKIEEIVLSSWNKIHEND